MKVLFVYFEVTETSRKRGRSDIVSSETRGLGKNCLRKRDSEISRLYMKVSRKSISKFGEKRSSW